MFDRTQTLTLRIASFGLSLLPLGLLACSSGSSGGTGDMFVESCSLGCNNGSDGGQVFCQIINAFENQEISVLFSEPVDPASVDASTFRVVEVGAGNSPGGQFLIDPSNARRLIFRPSLSFDQNGSPVFGFKSNTSYQIIIPGEGQGDSPPYIRNTGGGNNQSRMQCTIFTDQGVQDPVPGRPTVDIFVDLVTSFDMNGDPLTIDEQRLITMDPNDSIDGLRESQLTFVFSEIMNPATIADNVSGASTTIRVESDADGLVGTESDRTSVEGSFVVVVNQVTLSTRAVFTPTFGFPSGGEEGIAPTKPVFVKLLNSVADVVGQTITDSAAGVTYGFYPERRTFAAIELPRAGGESFDLSAGMAGSLEDAARSSGAWGSGRLSRGKGGGTGRLGDLIVASGETVVLNTDSMTFPMPGQVIDILGNDLAGEHPGEGANTVAVTDGGFEFGHVSVESGGILRFEGANPARLYSRGPLVVASGGLIDVSGETPVQHDSSIALPSLGKRVFKAAGGAFVEEDIITPFGDGGPGAGDGGYGADRYDHTGNPLILGLVANETDALDITTATGGSGVTVGRNGGGVGGTAAGRGLGGIRFPSGSFPSVDHNMSGNLETLNYNAIAGLGCFARQVGGSGSGGGFAFVGGEGQSASAFPIAEFPAGASNLPANTQPGNVDNLLVPANENNTGYFVRRLDFFAGALYGGAGGGGGGNHTYETQVSAAGEMCYDSTSLLDSWHDHSGAPGGGGGGAIQLRSGLTVAVDGVVDASGGDGGSGAALPDYNPNFGIYAMPGGGGSGGGIMLGAPTVSISAQPGRLDVSGGAGGATNFAQFPTEILALGGAGSQGLVRVEDSDATVDRPDLAPSVMPAGDMANNFGLDWISVAAGDFAPAKRRRPESMSGSVSCWVRPEGEFLTINYDSDGGAASEDQGWNMDIIYQADLQGAEVVIPFRGDNSAGAGIPNFEAMFGNLFNRGLADNTGSPVTVRFQGARITTATGTDFCSLEIDDPEIAAGSVTPWVEHPEELNTFLPAPNAMRFSVTFDRSVPPYATNGGNPTTAPSVRGVTNLLVKASPE
ncbi:MAG: hypothetical protein ACI8QZ_002360 [Chlamydiales bacterium]|jgi:hypothetical protein